MLHILFLILKIIGIILLAILGILILLLCIVLFIPVNYEVRTKTDEGLERLSLDVKAQWFFELISAYYIYKEKKSDWQVRIVWKKFNTKDYKKKKKDNRDKKEQLSKEKCTVITICDKIKSMWEMKNQLTEFLTDEIHIETFKIIKTEIGILARHIRPRRIRGFVKFGFEDPYHTGQMLAGLSVLYPFYGEHVEIYPDFEQKVLEGDLYIKGHISIVHLVAFLCRIFFNRYISQTYKDYKMLKSK